MSRTNNTKKFKNFNISVEYASSKSAWMNADIFKYCFHKSFVPQVWVSKHLIDRFILKCTYTQVRDHLWAEGFSPKALLILDNAPSHPLVTELWSEDGQIQTIFLPPNVTALIQPIDQNEIRLTKLYYRTSLLSTIISSNQPVGDLLKSLTLRDAVTNFPSNNMQPKLSI